MSATSRLTKPGLHRASFSIRPTVVLTDYLDQRLMKRCR